MERGFVSAPLEQKAKAEAQRPTTKNKEAKQCKLSLMICAMALGHLLRSRYSPSSPLSHSLWVLERTPRSSVSSMPYCFVRCLTTKPINLSSCQAELRVGKAMEFHSWNWMTFEPACRRLTH